MGTNLLIAMVAIAAVGVSCKERNFGDSNANSQQTFLASNVLHSLEQPFPDEEKLVNQAVELALKGVEKTKTSTGKSGRDFHTKAYGCVKATFAVHDSIDSKFKHGLFERPAVFPAWVRFSSGENGKNPDPNSGVTGMAIKLMNVPEEKVLSGAKSEKTQDFLLVNFPTMPVENIREYVALQSNPLLFVVTHPRKFAMLRTMQGQTPADPAETRFWSMAAYASGDSAVKYSAIPCSQPQSVRPENPSDDYMTDNLQKHLDTREACYKFMAQGFVDQSKTPVENTFAEWKESDAPFVEIARVVIPPQTFRFPEREIFCENLSMNPWHSLPENRPLGNLNRARRAVYEATSQKRHLDNRVLPVEPTPEAN